MSLEISDKDYYDDANYYAGAIDPTKAAINYIDPAPRPFEIKIPLAEYFERVTKHHADAWQIHFCLYLQDAALGRAVKPVKTIIHAQARLGKSRILAQVYPAWLLGHDPLHRIALATYNISQSEGHSEAVISIMNLDIHKAIFPDPAGWVNPNVAKDKWRTNARKIERTETERSFRAVGLQSGLTGAGFDTLLVDDPYADPGEAFSDPIRRRLTNFFWEQSVKTRIGEHSNVFGMFHRYHIQDLAGYLLDTGKFYYLRYAAVADGPYIHKATGQMFPDPLGRKEGEYISERFGDAYYEDKKENSQVWNSMFQGRPTSEEGDFFHVTKIRVLKGDELDEYRKKCVIWVRSWDNAATKDAGDFTAGAKLGIHPDGSILVDDVKLAQLDPAGRMKLQKETAEADGKDVIITVPKEVGEAGKSLVFFAQQYLRGFQVIGRSVVNSQNPGDTAKKRRAWNYSIATNSSQVAFASDDLRPDRLKWVERVLEAMRTFGFTSFDDPIDGMSDAYNELHERLHHGLLASNYRPQRNLFPYSTFSRMFPYTNGTGKPLLKVPRAFTTYVGVKISADASLPNSAVIVSRASENTNLVETHFTIAEYKAYDGDYQKLFEWLRASLAAYCEAPGYENTTIWLHPDSAHFEQTINEKLKVNVAVFGSDETTGYTELNWYFLETNQSHPSTIGENASRMYLLVPGQQISQATDGKGLINLRQELMTCGFDDKNKPAKTVGVLDCLRMCVAEFSTFSTRLTDQEQYARRLKAILPPKKTNGDIRTDVSDEMTVAMNEARLKRDLRKEGEFVPDAFAEEEFEGADISGGW